ncbi:MAG TPA: hypothetical protein VFO16_19475 [Pseudonocardiaceae bacterium]|nr:hypothetical protein [Pseudonocardiaceae bacterium]
MTIWFVAAIPVLIMFFALAMERVERRLRSQAARDSALVQPDDLEFPQGIRPVSGQSLNGVRGRLGVRRSAAVHSPRVGQRS